MLRYESDLTDKEWDIVKVFLPPPADDGRPRKYDFREIVNGIFYISKTGGQWRQLPKDFPKWKSVYGYFREWSNKGIWENINQELVKFSRVSMGKKEMPTVAIVDSQSVKTTKKGGLEDMTVASKSKV